MIESVPPVLVAMIAVAAVMMLPRKIGHSIAVVALGYVAAASLMLQNGTYITATLFGVFDVAPFVVDQASALMGIVFGVFGIAAVIYAYSSEMDSRTTGYALSYVAASVGAVFAGDWLTLIFFFELMAVASTLLVWAYGGKAVRAGFRYALYHGIGGSLLLLAIAGHYVSAGTFIFDHGIAGGWTALFAALGIGVNVGFIGLHSWLPDTYPRPHIAASVFLCVFTTKTGVYAMFRAFPEGHLWIAYMGAAMAVFGAFTALLQHDMRRLLSYHIQSQVGYMVAGVGIGSSLAIAGAFGHVFNHILYKGLLFMSVGVLIYRTNTSDLYELGGLWKKMPLTAIAFTIGALSITAVPGFNGFISKGMILNAAHELHGMDGKALYWMLKIGAIGTFLSFIKLGYYAFLHGESDLDVKDAKTGQIAGMGILAGLCVLFGIWWPGLVQILPTHGHELHLHPYSLSHIKDSAMLLGVSLIAFKVIRKPLSGVGHVPGMDAVIFPASFWISRIATFITAKTYATVDWIAVNTVRKLFAAGRNPDETAVSIGRKLPDFMLADQLPMDEGEPSRLSLRAGMGASIMILLTVLTLVLAILL